MKKIRRYAMRVREAGLGHSLRIIGTRLSGYVLWPRAWLSRLLGHHIGVRGKQGGAAGDNAAFLIIWSRADLDLLADARRLRDPDALAAVVERATKLLTEGAPVLAWGPAALRIPVAWHTDQTSSTKWPDVFHKLIDTAREGEPCDVKYPWELSRLQFLPLLAGAWLTTGKHRFREAVWNLIADWSEHNPWGYGVNWTCSMEIAIRAINISVALNLLQTSISEEQSRFSIRLLRAHERHLRWNLEVSDVGGNHLFFNYLGIAWLSLALGGPNSARFRGDLHRLAVETNKQFHPDGVHIEHATGYQRLMLEGLVLFLIALTRSGVEHGPVLLSVAKRALLFLEAVCDAGGATPAVGDSDSGNVLTLGAVAGNHAAQLFELCAAAGLGGPASRRCLDPQAAFWFGRGARAEPTATAKQGGLFARSFDDAGYYVVRGAGLVLVLRAGPSGLRGRGSHDHNDQLSFVLSVDGCPVLVPRPQ